MPGPLEGITVIELAGIGPGPHCCMMLADLGARVIRCEPPGGRSGLRGQQFQVPNRSRQSIIVDLKRPEGRDVILKLCETADGLVEGFRPGVMEKLGLGPEACAARNPRLVYGRGGKPVPPLNLVGDYGGGSMLLAFGLVAGLLQAKMTGKGNVVDAAMVDGAATLLAPTFGMVAAGQWDDSQRAANLLDGGAHFYDTYECKDGRYVSLGAIEPQFYALLLKLGGAEGVEAMSPKAQMKRATWPAAKAELEALMKTKTRDEWCTIMEGTDICFAPVLTMTEAFDHHHARARGAFVELDGVKQPAPAPRFSNTPAATPTPPPEVGADTAAVLRAAGLDVDKLLASGVVQDRSKASKL